jgi:hypothetical protein
MAVLRTGDANLRLDRLTHGFVKGTQRTPRKEIDVALWIRREDVRR